MITCPQCKHQEPEGAFFCSECGARLIRLNGLQTHSISQNNGTPTTTYPAPERTGMEDDPIKAASITPEKIGEGVTVSLRVLPSGDTIPLEGQVEFTVGRTSRGQSIIPDVDLSPFDAYAKGVSRLHAALRVENGEISLMDLGSVNGTFINQTKIPPNMYRRLQPGDIISLGKLRLQLVIE
ncbi:MAG: FHA domain-containing protein [Anaerolineae bacterium]|nr:MAG: FHA domain-containing protein [Anaerolineae bacterium]